MAIAADRLPLAGICVIERSRSVAAAYAGRLMAAMGAETIMLEDLSGSALRREPPLLQSAGGLSAVFAYLSAGKRSVRCDLATPSGRATLELLLQRADILIDDTPLAERSASGLEADDLKRFPQLIHASVLPFGSFGEKSAWKGEEINLIHASGEGYLLPNGLSNEMFPDRPPLKIYGHFAQYQGGVAAALSALAALWARPSTGGQCVDTAIQDAASAVGAFAIQRLGDGSLEHRAMRRFRYGGVFEGADGYIEFLMLEDRQWQAFVELLGRPAWAVEPWLEDPLERSRRGDEINAQIRMWALGQCVDDMVHRAQALGVPAAKYRGPDEILGGAHERARELFMPATLPGGTTAEVLMAPFQFRETPLRLDRGVPELGEYGQGPHSSDTAEQAEEVSWAR